MMKKIIKRWITIILNIIGIITICFLFAVTFRTEPKEVLTANSIGFAFGIIALASVFIWQIFDLREAYEFAWIEEIERATPISNHARIAMSSTDWHRWYDRTIDVTLSSSKEYTPIYYEEKGKETGVRRYII